MDTKVLDLTEVQKRWWDVIEWHSCGEHRHGSLRGIPKAALRDVDLMLRRTIGAYPREGAWWSQQGQTWAVEFTSRPWEHPWDMCGTTLLYADWRQQLQDREKARSRFLIGDRVAFSHRGVRYEGIISGGRKRATVIVGHSKWHVPYTQLTRLTQ